MTTLPAHRLGAVRRVAHLRRTDRDHHPPALAFDGQDDACVVAHSMNVLGSSLVSRSQRRPMVQKLTLSDLIERDREVL
jgi:hypothetical protein